MSDPELVAFLQWALPRLGLRWQGYRKVRARVREKLNVRLRELGLPGIAAYRDRLEVMTYPTPNTGDRDPTDPCRGHAAAIMMSSAWSRLPHASEGWTRP